MFTRLMHGTKAFVWLGASLVVLLILGLIIPPLLPIPPKPALITTSPIAPPTSQVINPSYATHTPFATTSPTISPQADTPTAAATTLPLTDEEVLARAVMPSSDHAYCSWQILGQAKLKLFVWAYCVDVGKHVGAKESGPAIIHLDDQGHYRQVEWAFDGDQYANLVKQFPPDARQAISEPNSSDGLTINNQALEWGVQMRGVEFNTPYIIPLFDPAGGYCVDGPTKTGQDLPLAQGKDYSGWKKYTQLEDGYSFNLPVDWSVKEIWFSCIQRPPAPHWLFLQPPGGLYDLLITFRKTDEAENIQRSGTPAGEFFDAGTLTFLGKQVRIQRLIYEKRDMAVFYNNSAEFPAGGLLFTLSLNIDSDPQNNGSIPPEIEAQAAQILKSFILSPNATVTQGTTTSESLTAPIPNNFGLVIEENEIRGSIELDPLNFQPVRGSKQEVMGRHTQAKEPQYIFETNYENNNLVMHAIAGGKEFNAVRVEQHEGSKSQLEVLLERSGKVIFSKNVGMLPFETLRGLWADSSGNWVLELVSAEKTIGGKEVQTDPTGQLYQNGDLLNQKYGYQEMFGYQLLNGKPFYFYQKAGHIYLSYDSQDLLLIYDEIPHYRCCSGAALNPVAAPNWVGFFGRKNDVWYYTAIGQYDTQ